MSKVNPLAALGTAVTKGNPARAKAGDVHGESRLVMASVSLPASLWRRVRVQAVSEGTKVQVLARRAFESFLDDDTQPSGSLSVDERTVMASVRVPTDLWRRMKLRAVTEETQVQHLARQAYEAYLNTV
jgi:hypothetical protein